MSNSDPIRINVDLSNPGQFFACCGLLELADRMWPGAEAWFDTTIFNLRTDGTLREILTLLLRDTPRQLESVSGDIPIKPIIAPLAFSFNGAASNALVIDFWMRVAVV